MNVVVDVDRGDDNYDDGNDDDDNNVILATCSIVRNFLNYK